MIRVGVIGLGAMGRNHARVYGELPDVELAAVCDCDAAALAAATRGRSLPRKGYTDFQEMLAQEALDAVSVAVPTALHAAVAGAVIERGISVLVEKPIASTLDEGQRLAEAARRQGVTLAVGHVERFNPAIGELKRRLQAGELGKVFQIQARRTGPFPARIRDVGVVTDLATHDLDIMRYLLESSLERVYAETAQRIHTAHEDLLLGLVKFRNGAIGLLDINWLTPTKIRELTVLGEGGMFVANYLTQDLYFYENDRPQGGWPALDTLTGVAEGNMIRFRLARQEPLRAELEDFVAAVAEGREPLVTAEDGLEALRMAQMLREAGQLNQVLRCGPTWEGAG